MLLIFSKGGHQMSEDKLLAAAIEVERQIKAAMVLKGVTSIQLAKRLKVSQSELSKAIHGYVNPNSNNIRQKIYKILEMK